MTVHTIIHSSAAAAGGVGAGLAQAPGADTALLVPIQTAMILSLADEFGASITKAVAADLVLTFGASMAGRAFSQWALGWVPGLGNAVNAATAATLTEAIGWAAVDWFESGGGR